MNIPQAIQQQILERGLSAVLDEVSSREETARAELLYWKQIRQSIEAQIAAPIDELSEIAEAAFVSN